MSMRPADMARSLDMATHAIMEAPGMADEVSLLFAEPAELDQFVAWMVEDCGGIHFASVDKDEMVRLDRPGKFNVRFEFLRLPHRDWRIEAMYVFPGGEAPLHEHALNVFGTGCPVHLSYKCSSLDGYQTEVLQLREHGDRMHAEYRNSYGMFSYWQPERRASAMPFMKPRVNMRDQ